MNLAQRTIAYVLLPLRETVSDENDADQSTERKIQSHSTYLSTATAPCQDRRTHDGSGAAIVDLMPDCRVAQ
jgi:hypothetical protein